MPSFVRKAWLIYCKDLREGSNTSSLHPRVRHDAGIVFSFALQLVEAAPEAIFPAVLWVSIVSWPYLPCSLKEKDSGALDALLLAAGDRGILFYAKFLFSLTVRFCWR